MKIIADRFIPFLRGRLEGVADIEYIHPDEFTSDRVKDADALLIRTRTRCNATLLEGTNVRMIATATIGMDQFDLPWCKQAGIATYNSPGCNAPAVAQYVWSSLLHTGIIPSKITIGVVGHGNVGSIVADWGKKLGARVLLCDPFKAEGSMHPEKYISLEQMAAEADVMTLHTPLTRSGEHPTYHLIGESILSMMRPGAVLVNAARGAVVDSEAVARKALQGSIRLITDCWEGEPANLHPVILERSEIATPHIAGYSLQGKQRATRMIIEALGHHFGLPVAIHEGEEGIKVYDLPAPYIPWDTVKGEEIMASYNPVAETKRLKADPDDFEHWRDNYDYRPELYMG